MFPLARTALLLCGVAACSPSYQTTSGQDYIASHGGVTDPGIAAAAEAEALLPLTEDAQGFGEFVPLSPILGTMMTTDQNAGLLDRVQLIAARQHMDYALVLNFDTSSSSVQAVFLDVRTGYPYATAQVVTDDSPVGWRAGADRINRRTLALTEEILPDLAQMMNGLAARSVR